MFTDELKADQQVISEVAQEVFTDLTAKERSGITLHRRGVHGDALVHELDAMDMVGVGAMDSAGFNRVFQAVR